MPIEQPGMPKLRWFQPTPGKLLIILLAVEGVLLMSERWFPKGWAALVALAVVGLFLLLMLLWFVLALLFRWRFQFSVRSLLIFVTLFGVACSWFAVKEREAIRQRRTILTLHHADFQLAYDYEIDASGELIYQARSHVPQCLRELFGEDYFANVIYAEACDEFLRRSRVTDDDLQLLQDVPHLQILRLWQSTITDAGLRHIAKLKGLKRLILIHTKVTNAGIAKLQKALPNCTITIETPFLSPREQP